MKNAGPSFFYTSRPYKVIICIVTIWSFLFNTVFQGIGIQDLAWAQRSDLGFTGVGPKIGSGPGRNMTRLLNPEAFNMPSYLGQVKHIASCNSRKIIFHIQDAHCNDPAQLKIAEIIDYLAREYDIKLVNLEGGEGEYDLSIFTDIQNRKLRKKVSDYFLKHGEINGAEFFAINTPDRVRLYGIEDAEHYIENLNAYRKTLKLKPGIDKGLKDLSQIIDSLKTKIYSEKLLELDRKYEDYKHRELDFKTYVSYLVDESRGRGVNLKKFENIYLLDKVFELEKDINFKKCNRERDAILDKLQKMLSKLEVQELVKKVLDFKLGSITQTEFYTYLTRKVKELNIELGMSSNLKLYIGYITIYESIDKDMVFAELEGLEDAVKETLFESGFQRQLNTLSRRLEIIKGISDISLTRDEYRIYLARRDEFKLRNFTSFIQKEAPKYNTPSRIEKDIEGLDRYLNKMQDFYRCADRRDLAFVENSKWIMGASKADMAIMISGGFHTDGLKELCKRNNISYIAILPNFRNGNGYKSPYFELLSGGSSPLTDYIYTHQSSIAIASYLTVMAGKHDVLGYPKIQAFKGAVEVAKWFFNEEGDKEGPFTYDLVDRGNIITTIEFSRTGREGQMIPGTEDFPIYARDTGIGAQLALKGRSESEATAERIPPERFNTNDLRRALVVFITMACLAYSSGPIHRGAHYARRSATGTRASATGVASDDRSEVINLEPAEMIGLSVKEFDTFGESEIPPTGPPVDDERIRELYSADRRFIDGTPLTDEMILQAVRDKAKELSQDPTLSETERGALYGQLTEIEGWITGHDKRHYTDIYALARASAAYLSQIAESGFSVHFPRWGILLSDRRYPDAPRWKRKSSRHYLLSIEKTYGLQ